MLTRRIPPDRNIGNSYLSDGQLGELHIGHSNSTTINVKSAQGRAAIALVELLIYLTRVPNKYVCYLCTRYVLVTDESITDESNLSDVRF